MQSTEAILKCKASVREGDDVTSGAFDEFGKERG